MDRIEAIKQAQKTYHSRSRYSCALMAGQKILQEDLCATWYFIMFCGNELNCSIGKARTSIHTVRFRNAVASPEACIAFWAALLVVGSTAGWHAFPTTSKNSSACIKQVACQAGNLSLACRRKSPMPCSTSSCWAGLRADASSSFRCVHSPVAAFGSAALSMPSSKPTACDVP